jgi:hypothetical protein
MKSKSSTFFKELKKMGCIKYEEVVIIITLIILVTLWISREFPFEGNPGWVKLIILIKGIIIQ